MVVTRVEQISSNFQQLVGAAQRLEDNLSGLRDKANPFFRSRSKKGETGEADVQFLSCKAAAKSAGVVDVDREDQLAEEEQEEDLLAYHTGGAKEKVRKRQTVDLQSEDQFEDAAVAAPKQSSRTFARSAKAQSSSSSGGARKSSSAQKKGDKKYGYAAMGDFVVGEDEVEYQDSEEGEQRGSARSSRRLKRSGDSDQWQTYRLEQFEALDDHVPSYSSSGFAGQVYGKSNGKSAEASARNNNHHNSPSIKQHFPAKAASGSGAAPKEFYDRSDCPHNTNTVSNTNITNINNNSSSSSSSRPSRGVQQMDQQPPSDEEAEFDDATAQTALFRSVAQSGTERELYCVEDSEGEGDAFLEGGAAAKSNSPAAAESSHFQREQREGQLSGSDDSVAEQEEEAGEVLTQEQQQPAEQKWLEIKRSGLPEPKGGKKAANGKSARPAGKLSKDHFADSGEEEDSVEPSRKKPKSSAVPDELPGSGAAQRCAARKAEVEKQQLEAEMRRIDEACRKTDLSSSSSYNIRRSLVQSTVAVAVVSSDLSFDEGAHWEDHDELARHFQESDVRDDPTPKPNANGEPSAVRSQDSSNSNVINGRGNHKAHATVNAVVIKSSTKTRSSKTEIIEID